MNTMSRSTTRHRSADVAVGYAADGAGVGYAYAIVGTGAGRGEVRVPFTCRPLAALEGREAGYAAVAAVAAHLRGRGYTRVRLRFGHAGVVDELSGRVAAHPALAMAYVKTRCALHAFAVARVERAEPVEIEELTARARADIGERASAAA